ncbi:hypothetical protein CY34DRAFT_467380 [Suillus luteus UH-Slu-Lm8-n1]|uniref:Uncharacterized protein n=1 Tax=Suillus luteus UH-Slu-Lm8-n1 TaxID=930992 RepID=A0A0C9ZIQ8_9AGAM|nr:hypothetical protein CY34DRAFT_467380 [Suillus luteus UH-Slu-Lm8-n1]
MLLQNLQSPAILFESSRLSATMEQLEDPKFQTNCPGIPSVDFDTRASCRIHMDLPNDSRFQLVNNIAGKTATRLGSQALFKCVFMHGAIVAA